MPPAHPDRWSPRLASPAKQLGKATPTRMSSTTDTTSAGRQAAQAMLSRHSPPGWHSLRRACIRLTERLTSARRSSLATPNNVFIVRCEICGLLKIARRLDEPPSQCPLCASPLSVLVHYRLYNRMPRDPSATGSDDPHRGIRA